MYALIADERIVQLSEVPFDVAEPLFWIEIIGYDATQEYTYNNGIITAVVRDDGVIEI